MSPRCRRDAAERPLSNHHLFPGGCALLTHLTIDRPTYQPTCCPRSPSNHHLCEQRLFTPTAVNRSPSNHRLFPAPARLAAATLMRVGARHHPIYMPPPAPALAAFFALLAAATPASAASVSAALPLAQGPFARSH